MSMENDLREELLRQMNEGAGAGPDATRKAIRAILAKDEARLRRLRRAAVVAWIVLAASFLASGTWGALTGFRSETWTIASIIGLQALLIAAAALTLILSFRSRAIRMKAIQAALAEIQDKLKAMEAEGRDQRSGAK
jgi:hypothetical protein